MLSKCLYSYYKKVGMSCKTKLMVVFIVIYEYMDIEYDDLTSILRRFINTFSNAFAKKESDKIVDEKKKKKGNQIKQTRLSGGRV